MEKRMSWAEMVEKYPDCWVVVKDAKKDGPDIVSGVLVAVKRDDEISLYRVENNHKGYVFRRTTEGAFNGVTGSDVVISVN